MNIKKIIICIFAISIGVIDSKAIERNDNEILAQEERYSEVTTVYNHIGVISSFEREITKEEYDTFEVASDCSGLCYETNAKILRTGLIGGEEKSYFQIYTELIWKKVPKVKSFDTIAFRWETTETLVVNSYESFGNQVYCIDSDNCPFIEYMHDGKNTKKASNGVGISMNLADEGTSNYECYLWVTLNTSGRGTFKYYTTYQHAVSNITLATAQNYTFGDGLGGVLNYPSTIQNKFDNMKGLSVSFKIPDVFV